MSLPVQSLNLSGIDMIFALSQDAIQSGLASYFLQDVASFSYACKMNDTTLVLCDLTDPDALFTFTDVQVSLPPQVSGSTTYFLDMSATTYPSCQVLCNLGIDQGTLTELNNGTTVASCTVATPWAFSFNANLLQMVASGKTLPQLAALQAQYGDIFALNQLLIDMTSSIYNSSSAMNAPQQLVQDNLFLIWPYVVEGLVLYLAANAATVFPTPPTLSYMATATSTPSNLPALAITDCSFYIDGNSSAPGQSALIYMAMTNNATMTTTPEDVLGPVLPLFNSESAAGYFALRSGILTEQIQAAMPTNIPSLVACYIQTDNSADNLTWNSATYFTSDNLTWQGPLPSLALWNMPEQSTSEIDQYFDGNTAIFADSNCIVSVAFDFMPGTTDQMLAIFGVQSTTLSSSNNNGAGWSSPLYSMPWSVAYQMEDINNSGSNQAGMQLQYQASLSNLAGTVTASGSGSGSIITTPPSPTELATYYAPAFASMQTVLNSIPGLSLTGLNLFAYPGSGDFSFSNASINQFWNAYAEISLQSS